MARPTMERVLNRKQLDAWLDLFCKRTIRDGFIVLAGS